MAIESTAALEEDMGGRRRKLLLRNGEIERFEALHGGVFDFWRQLAGELPGIKASACRDLVALALVGGGCPDREADAIVAALGPDQNFRLRAMAQRALGLAFFPAILTAAPDGEKKSPAGSSRRRSGRGGMTSPPASETSAA